MEDFDGGLIEDERFIFFESEDLNFGIEINDCF